MEYLGQPFAIQNTADHFWLVTWGDAVSIKTESGLQVESVSFTVSIPKRANLTIAEVQRHALKRAVELLSQQIKLTEQGAERD